MYEAADDLLLFILTSSIEKRFKNDHKNESLSLNIIKFWTEHRHKEHNHL